MPRRRVAQVPYAYRLIVALRTKPPSRSGNGGTSVPPRQTRSAEVPWLGSASRVSVLERPADRRTVPTRATVGAGDPLGYTRGALADLRDRAQPSLDGIRARIPACARATAAAAGAFSRDALPDVRRARSTSRSPRRTTTSAMRRSAWPCNASSTRDPGALAEVGVWRGETSAFLHGSRPSAGCTCSTPSAGFPTGPAGGSRRSSASATRASRPCATASAPPRTYPQARLRPGDPGAAWPARPSLRAAGPRPVRSDSGQPRVLLSAAVPRRLSDRARLQQPGVRLGLQARLRHVPGRPAERIDRIGDVWGSASIRRAAIAMRLLHMTPELPFEPGGGGGRGREYFLCRRLVERGHDVLNISPVTPEEAPHAQALRDVGVENWVRRTSCVAVREAIGAVASRPHVLATAAVGSRASARDARSSGCGCTRPPSAPCANGGPTSSWSGTTWRPPGPRAAARLPAVLTLHNLDMALVPVAGPPRGMASARRFLAPRPRAIAAICSACSRATAPRSRSRRSRPRRYCDARDDPRVCDPDGGRHRPCWPSAPRSPGRRAWCSPGRSAIRPTARGSAGSSITSGRGAAREVPDAQLEIVGRDATAAPSRRSAARPAITVVGPVPAMGPVFRAGERRRRPDPHRRRHPSEDRRGDGRGARDRLDLAGMGGPPARAAGTHLLVADEPAAFAAAVVHCCAIRSSAAGSQRRHEALAERTTTGAGSATSRKPCSSVSSARRRARPRRPWQKERAHAHWPPGARGRTAGGGPPGIGGARACSMGARAPRRPARPHRQRTHGAVDGLLARRRRELRRRRRPFWVDPARHGAAGPARTPHRLRAPA